MVGAGAGEKMLSKFVGFDLRLYEKEYLEWFLVYCIEYCRSTFELHT